MPRRNRSIACLGLLAMLAPTTSMAQSLLPGGWSGPYWGLTGGGAWADVKGANSSSDLAWSAHAGYGVQLSALYVGGEIDGTWGGANSTSHLSPLFSSSLEVDWSATARARVGVVIAGALIYATGGVAWSAQTLGIHSLGAELSSHTSTVPGAVFGAGVEVKVLPFVSARLEALHYDFSSQSDRFRDTLPASLSAGALRSIDLDETVVRAGLSLRFN